MKVRPLPGGPPGAIFGPRPGDGPRIPDVANDIGGIVQPWLVSGGATMYRAFPTVDPAPIVSAEPDAVQLVCAFYVAQGQTGFLKELFVVPCCPPQLAAHSVPISWPTYDTDALGGPVRAAATHGYYETPLGWESQFTTPGEGGDGVPPRWQWHLRLIQGDVLKGRPPFDATDPATWFLAPDVAVPASAYVGLPGQAPWPAQRVQVGPNQPFETHLVVQGDTTICLFAVWSQVAGMIDDPTVPGYQPKEQFSNLPGGPATIANYGNPVFPLLPSVGRMHGYTQAAAREATVVNAQHGWGG